MSGRKEEHKTEEKFPGLEKRKQQKKKNQAAPYLEVAAIAAWWGIAMVFLRQNKIARGIHL